MDGPAGERHKTEQSKDERSIGGGGGGYSPEMNRPYMNSPKVNSQQMSSPEVNGRGRGCGWVVGGKTAQR